MILTILKLGWLNLRRDRVAQSLTFALPIVFFSIFASVFGGQGSGTSRIRIAVVDEDHSDLSSRIIEGLKKETGLRVRTGVNDDGTGTLDRVGGEKLVREGDVPVTVVIPHGLGANFASSGFGGGGPSIELLADVSDKIAPQMVLGLIQKVTMTVAPDLMMQGGLSQFEKRAGALTDQQRTAVQAWLPTLKQQSISTATPSDGAAPMGVGVKVVDVMASTSRRGSLVSFYAAGIGVMFLLFSRGRRRRRRSSRRDRGGHLRARALDTHRHDRAAARQVAVSRTHRRGAARRDVSLGRADVQAALVFASRRLRGNDRGDRCGGRARGLVLATLAKSRGQLQGFSTILILTMSALGGSMFPRFLMTETMQKFGLLTFNGWALDGYLKVFWRELPIVQLWPQVLVLLILTVVFLSLARVLARRWESA